MNSRKPGSSAPAASNAEPTEQGKKAQAVEDSRARYVKSERSKTRDKERTRRQLELAIEGLQASKQRISIVAVAEAADVHPSLIHHVYPEIAERVRRISGKTREAKAEQEAKKLSEALKTISELRAQLSVVESNFRRMASLNLTLTEQVRALIEGNSSSAGKVRQIKK